MSKKLISIVNLFLFLLVVTVNALANILPINGLNTGEISDFYPNLFVPAGITFSIWGLIYIQLLLLVIYTTYISFRDESRDFTKFNIYIGINFIFNSLWIILWHYRFIVLSWIVMLLLLIDLILLDNYLGKKTIHSYIDKVALRLTISTYLGWISVATVANTTALLVSKGWNNFGLSSTFWGVTIIIIGGVIAALSLILKNSIPFALVFIWAYIGIILKRVSIVPVNNYIINSAGGCIIFLLTLSVCTYIRIKPKKVVL